MSCFTVMFTENGKKKTGYNENNIVRFEIFPAGILYN